MTDTEAEYARVYWRGRAWLVDRDLYVPAYGAYVAVGTRSYELPDYPKRAAATKQPSGFVR